MGNRDAKAKVTYCRLVRETTQGLWSCHEVVTSRCLVDDVGAFLLFK